MKQKTFRIPKNKKVTIGDLLGQSEVNSVLEKVLNDKPIIDGIVVIIQDTKGGISWRSAGFAPLEVIGLLEQVKSWELGDDYDGE